MAFIPTFKLFAQNGVDLVYQFEHVLDWGNGPFIDPQTYAEHKSLRGQGSIISDGSDDTWNFILDFYLSGTDYADLVANMKAVKTAVVFNTKYILKIQLTAGGSTEDLYVKRLSPVLFPISSTKSKVVKSQKGKITFVVGTWK
jgi:hypothetical protein